MARESGPLNKECCNVQSPKGNMGGLEYSRPGGLEAWIRLECLEAWRPGLDWSDCWMQGGGIVVG